MGKSTFELARGYDQVVGVDFSEAFIGVCINLKLSGEMPYSLSVEGDLTEDKIAVVDPAIVSLLGNFLAFLHIHSPRFVFLGSQSR